MLLSKIFFITLQRNIHVQTKQQTLVKAKYTMRRIFVLLLLASILHGIRAQEAAIKTNLLYDATATINLGAEMALAPKWTLDLSANYNAWEPRKDKKWKHWMAQPEARYWLCEAFNGHFFGAHLLGGQYNVGGIDLPFGIYDGLKTHRYEGWYIGGGLVYGYQWLLGKRWSLEAALGLGYVRAWYDRYECPHCGEWLGEGKKNYLGVTKAAISLIYIIK